MTNKEIKTILQNGKAQFTIEGVTTYGTDENGNFGEILKVLEMDSSGEAMWLANTLVFSGMNVDGFFPNTFKVYGFDLMGNRTKSTINYSRVTILNCG